MSGLDFRILSANWDDVSKPASAIRREVFIEEQGVPTDEEWDGKDHQAYHFLALCAPDQRAIGTARLLPDGKLTRMAVLEAFRGQGVGRALLNAALSHAQEHALPPLFLDAQIDAVPFYQKFGFVAQGNPFWDANILHLRMCSKTSISTLPGGKP